MTKLLTFSVLFFSLALFNMARAHEMRPAIIDINLSESGEYTGEIKLNLEAIIADISSQSSNTDDDKNADKYTLLRALSPTELQARFNISTFLKRIVFSSNQQALELKAIQLTIPPVGDVSLLRDSVLYFKGNLPNNITQLTWQWDKQLGDSVLRVNGAKGQELFTDYLIAGNNSGDISVKNAIKRSTWQTIKNYIQIGFEHILPKGLDHILFVVGIFLLSAKFRALLWQLSSFTLAHSVTLALSMLGVISVSASIVEPLIAASIVYVCIENIFLDHLSRWRPYLVFAFGLLHGLGFASVLNEIGIQDGHFVSSLIAFNVGVELGQIVVILACFALVGLWFRNKPWYRARVTVPFSIVIAMIGSYWFIERVFL